MINTFRTLFEARERKFQQERLFRGESVDLVARITTDGVMDTLNGYSISGVYQPTDDLSGDFYPLNAEISDGSAILHWTNQNDFGKDAYNVWGLLTKDGKAAYPICWRLMFAHSPSYPLGTPDPLPRTIDFSQYELLNAPWAMLSDLEELQCEVYELSDGLSAYAKKEDIPEVEGKYLPLSGGTVTGALSVTGTFESSNFKGDAGVGIMIGYNAKAKSGSIAIGSSSDVTNAHFGGSNVAIGTAAKIGSSSETDCAVAVGVGTTVNGNHGIAIGHSAAAEGANSIAIGSSGARVQALAPESIQIGGLSNGLLTPNNTPHSLKVFDKMVLSGDNLTLDPERIPYLSAYAKTEDLSTNYATKSDMLVATTHINDLSSSLSGTQVQMALYDGRFALPETVVQRGDGTIELYDFNGTVSFDDLSTSLGEMVWFTQRIMAISFGSNLSVIHIGPNVSYSYSGTSTPVFSVTDSDEILSAKAQYLNNAFGGCKTINIPSTINSYNFYQGGNVLSTTTLYAGNQRIGEFTIGNSDSCPGTIEAFGFCGLSNAKQITVRCPASSTVRFAPHFIDYCTNLEVLDLRDVASVTYISKSFKIGNRVKQLSYEPKIENVNPNLKIIVSDSEYTRLMGIAGFSTWQPYLVKASDWEYAHTSDLSAYAQLSDIPEVPTDLSAFTNSPGYLTAHQSLSGYATKDELSAAISSIEVEGDYLPLSGGTVTGRIYYGELADVFTHHQEFYVSEVSATFFLDFEISAERSFLDGTYPYNFDDCERSGNIIMRIRIDGDPQIYDFGSDTFSILADLDENTEEWMETFTFSMEGDFSTPTFGGRFPNTSNPSIATCDPNGPSDEGIYPVDDPPRMDLYVLDENEGEYVFLNTVTFQKFWDDRHPLNYLTQEGTRDPFVLSSEFAAALGDIDSILDFINGQTI